MTLLILITYALTLWFGLYLLRRNFSKPGMRFAGLGLLAFALSLLPEMLIANTATVELLRLTPVIPSICWCIAALHIITPHPIDLLQKHRRYLLPALFICGAAIAVMEQNPLYGLLGIPPVLIAYAVWIILRSMQIADENSPVLPLRLLFVTQILFFMSAGLIILAITEVDQTLRLALLGADLLMLGFGISALDAYDEGETLLPDMLNSLGFTLILVTLFSGQIALVMLIEDETAQLLTALLVATTSTAVIIQIFYADIQALLDHQILRQRAIRIERDQLRAVNAALPRQKSAQALQTISDPEFTRLTRRALSAMGNLNRLAASPLIHLLPLSGQSTLERATELRQRLAESIDKLKPQGDDAFGTTDEWRHYNALYFPYVVGLKPFSQRQPIDDLAPNEQEAIDWFRIHVPERTLYNWQNAAAELIAAHLRERSHANWQ